MANSPTFDEASVGFFRTSMNNLLAAGERAGVRHQVILSIVGVDQVPQLVYYRAKTLQEGLLRQGATPYSIVHATQFFEFMNTLVFETSDDTAVRLPSTRLQPIAQRWHPHPTVADSRRPPACATRVLSSVACARPSRRSAQAGGCLALTRLGAPIRALGGVMP